MLNIYTPIQKWKLFLTICRNFHILEVFVIQKNKANSNVPTNYYRKVGLSHTEKLCIGLLTL